MLDEGEAAAASQLETRRIFSGKVISLDLDTVRYPDGSIGEIEIVRHPGASAVIAFVDDPAAADPRIVLVRQYRHATAGYLLEIPAGRLNAGEHPRTCALRELKEETGFTATRCDNLTTFFTTPGFSDEKIHLFSASDLTAGESAVEPDEFLRTEVVRLSRALELVSNGQIEDAKTALAVLIAGQNRR